MAERFHSSLAEIENQWSTDDVVTAHGLLDAIEGARTEE